MAFTVSLVMLQSQRESGWGGGGGGRGALLFRLNGLCPGQGTGFQGHRLMFVTAVLFLLKLQEHFQLSLLQSGQGTAKDRKRICRRT